MSIIKAETLRNRIYNGGAHGNVSVAFGRAVLNAAAIADVVEVLEIPPGMHFIGVRLSTVSGLGTSVTVTAKVGTTALATAANVASANTNLIVACTPFVTATDEKLTLTIAGGVATGDISVIPEYVAEGI